MKFSVPFPVTMFALGVALVLVSALALRVAPAIPAPSVSEHALPSATSTADAALSQSATSSATIPAFTSASFADGDSLKGLGPEWTILDQQSPDASATGTVLGLRPTRVTTIKLVDHPTSLDVVDEIIADSSQLATALRKRSVVTIGGRNGYVVGAGFLIVGSRDALFVRDRSGAWPKQLAESTIAYIGSVRVP